MSPEDIAIVTKKRDKLSMFIVSQNRLPKNQRDHIALAKGKVNNARLNSWLRGKTK